MTILKRNYRREVFGYIPEQPTEESIIIPNVKIKRVCMQCEGKGILTRVTHHGTIKEIECDLCNGTGELVETVTLELPATGIPDTMYINPTAEQLEKLALAIKQAQFGE